MHVDEVRGALRDRGISESNVLESRAAKALGLRLSWNYYSEGRQSGAANVVRAVGAEVEGVALLVTEEGLRGIDMKEGYRRSDPPASSYYRRLRRIRLLD